MTVAPAARRATDAVPALAVLAAGLAAWEAVVVLTGVPALVLPSPVTVAATGVAEAPTLSGAAATTALTAAAGLALGVVVGTLLAFAMTVSRTAAAVVHPYVIALRVAPLVAIGPLVFLWLGDGVPARAMLVATLTVFPVTIASLDGLRSTPRGYLDLMRSVAAPRRATFLRVRVPAAAPSVFAGVKLAAALSVVGAIVAEFLTLRSGIGYRLFASSRALDTATTFAALAVVAGLGLVFYLVPAACEARIRW